MIDFPKHYTQDPALVQQNHALKKKYNINGVPHVIIFRDDAIVTHAHYMNNHTPQMYIEYIEGLLPSR